jgi:tRNA U34 5-carboxymethylaminomethyl modifying GTPase MnmE/TrmE
MTDNAPHQILTDPKGGAIQIVRFRNKLSFETFAKQHLSRNRSGPWKRLELCYLREENDQYGQEEVIVVYCRQPELHIHGGMANLNAFFKKAQNTIYPSATSTSAPTKAPEDLWLELWEETFHACFGLKSIQYMLNLIVKGSKLKKTNYSTEGFDFIKPIKAVLVGPPNAGKSTLFNYLLGEQRALVSNTEGTTRDLLKAKLQIGGYPFEIIDTAGLDPTAMHTGQSSGQSIQEQSARLSLNTISEADIILALRCKLPSSIKIKGELIELHSKCDEGYDQNSQLSFSVKENIGLTALIELLTEKALQLKPEPISDRFSPLIPKHIH